MQKIVPHLWYDREAVESAKLYTSLFQNSGITDSSLIKDTPSGDAERVSFVLENQPFESISGGPFFQFNHSASFMVHCKEEEVDGLWEGLSRDGSVLMPLGPYPFSPRYGWCSDRYGLNWQLLTGEGYSGLHKIVPCLLFSGSARFRAEEAADFYLDVFRNSEKYTMSPHVPVEGQETPPGIAYGAIRIEDLDLVVMDHAEEETFTFNESFSLIVSCDSQEEIDYYWDRLSADPEAEACGWLKDQFGVSWQIVPSILGDLMGDADEATGNRIIQTFLQMKKFIIADLIKASEPLE